MPTYFPKVNLSAKLSKQIKKSVAGSFKQSDTAKALKKLTKQTRTAVAKPKTRRKRK